MKLAKETHTCMKEWLRAKAKKKKNKASDADIQTLMDTFLEARRAASDVIDNFHRIHPDNCVVYVLGLRFKVYRITGLAPG